MPKPLLLARPSGLYVRFLIPQDLRPRLRSRFIVRPLHASQDTARLVAACMGLALSHAFAAIRQGHMVDINKLLKAAQAAGRRDLTIKGLTLPNGTVLDSVEINDENDSELFRVALENIGRFSASDIAAVERHMAENAKAAAPKGELLSVAIAKHLGDLEAAGRDGKTVLESRHTLRLLLGIVGDKPMAALNLDDMRAFFRDVVCWPRNASRMPHNKDKSVADIIAAGRAEGVTEPAPHTMNKYRQRLAVFFNSAASAKLIAGSPLDGLPARAAADSEDDSGRAFTADELKRIFDPSTFMPWASKAPHRWWGPMLGLYTGARVNEVGQLYVADVEVVDGIPGVHFNTRFPGQKIKRRSSVRFVPLAPAIIKAGFLLFVDDVRRAGHERVFPHLPNGSGLGFGKQLTKQFSAHLKGLGIDEFGLGFHAFRHTLATLLDAAGQTEARIGALTGHATKKSVLGRFYIDRPTLPQRLKTLEAFKPGVVLPRYKAGQFDVELKAVSVSPPKSRAVNTKGP